VGAADGLARARLLDRRADAGGDLESLVLSAGLGREMTVATCSRKPATALYNQPVKLPMLMTMPVVVVHDRFIEMT
jgi:hypothetical protein